jgi:hypothetical protein
MSPLDQLGLPPDADERMIKRAYAHRLRDTRPDTDPEGFQHLHAIYQAALAQCRRGTTVTVAGPSPMRGRNQTAVLTPVPAPTPAPTSATAPSPAPARASATGPVIASRAPEATAGFSLDRFLAELAELAVQGDAVQMRSWLEAQPALWSLRLKAQVGHSLFTRLYREALPMPESCLTALLDFFDMNHALAGHDPLALQRLQRRMQLAWDLLPQNRDILARRLGMRNDRKRRTLDRLLHRLTRAFHWREVIRIALMPNADTRLVRFVMQLSKQHPEDLPANCDRRRIGFSLEAADRRQVGKARLLVGGIRCAAALSFGLLLGVLLGIATRLPPERFAYGALTVTVMLAALPCLIWASWMAWLPLQNWQAMPEHAPARWPWLNLLLVPLLCIAGLAISFGVNGSPLALLLLFPALWLAFLRYRRKSTLNLRISPRVIWLAMCFVYLFLNAASRAGGFGLPVIFIALAAIAMWGIDLWRHRRRLRVARTA